MQRVTNTDGTITSQVSANTEAGFSIVKFTGSLTSGQTVGHGLTEPPSVVILKDLDSVADWYIYHKGTGTTSGYINYLRFDNTSGTYSDKIFYPINFNASTFTPGNDGSVLQGSVIAYCFAEVDGFSKFGSYTGTGAAGNSIVTGFEPAFVMVKSSSLSNTNWVMLDNKRAVSSSDVDKWLKANTSGQDDTGADVSFNSNGFTFNLSSNNFNGSGASYIFMAFAEEVFVPDNFFNDDSTVATYKLDGDAGDNSGNGYNGTATNVTYATGKFDEAAVFNGTNDYINLGNGLTSGLTNSFTVSLWLKIDTSPSGNTCAFSFQRTIWFDMFVPANNILNVRLLNSSVGSSAVSILNPLVNGTWNNVVFVADKTNSIVKLYLNGQLQGSASWNGTKYNRSQKNVIGSYGTGTTAFFPGSVDQVRIFDRALDSGEVTQLYNE